MGAHAGTEFNIHTRLDQFAFGFCVALSYASNGFVGIQINKLTGANGLGNIIATVLILLDVGGCFLMDGSIRGIVGGGCIHTKLHLWFLLGRSRCLLGAGALGALAFAAMEAAMASSTSARTSGCWVASHGSKLFGY